jgi:SAM-dependent methyltransferase
MADLPRPEPEPDGRPRSAEWATWRDRVDLDDYDARWARMAAAGQNPHGEADFVMAFAPGSVLDAGCGTGRVGVELARRGVHVVGADLDDDLLGRARAKAPDVGWVHADLADLDLGEHFDVVVAAGNVIGFVVGEARPAAIAGCARHLEPGGRLVAGFQLRAGWPTLADYDGWCADAGLVLEDRFATWDRQPLGPSPDYAVSVHRRPD